VLESVLGRLGPVAALRMARHLVEAHRATYDLIHRLDARARVSSNLIWFGEQGLARLAQRVSDALFMNQIADKMDYVGFDYYYRWSKPLDFVRVTKEPWRLGLAPRGMYLALKLLAARYPHLPLLITETGMSTDNGKPRADGHTRERVLTDTVYWMQRAMAEGVPVEGYMVWSLTDNYEWGSYAPRFGLYTVDVLTDPTLTRRPTAAVPVYRDIIRRGGVAPGYAPRREREALPLMSRVPRAIVEACVRVGLASKGSDDESRAQR
jgi:beta-glucosidase